MIKKMKVFIGDDSARVREWLNSVLEQIGDVEIVGYSETIAEMPEKILSSSPDLVILDFKTSGKGLEVLKRIKEILNPPQVVVFANRPGVYYRKRYVEAGANYFFDRSIEQKELAEKLRELIDKYQRGENG